MKIMTKSLRLSFLFPLFIILLLSNCAVIPFVDDSLYQRLGGKTGIEAVVDEFTNEIVADDRINHFFAHSDLDDFKLMLTAQICQASGGACQYEGGDMLLVHEGLGIRESDFNALVEDLIKTLHKFAVPEQEINELLDLLGPMKADIVEPELIKSKPEPIIKKPSPVIDTTVIEETVKIKPVPTTIIDKLKPKSTATPSASVAKIKKEKIKEILKTKPKLTPQLTKITEKPASLPEPTKIIIKKPTTGDIKGHVSIVGNGSKSSLSHRTIIVLEPLNKTNLIKKSPRSHVVIMKKKTYLPGLLAVQTNDKIAFHNLDKIKHNVFSASRGNRFDLGTFRKGKRPEIQLKKTGIVKVYCDIHHDMATFIRVTDSPFYSITDTAGTFNFSNIPFGSYQLIAWNIRGNSEQIIKITDDKSNNVEVLLDTRRYQAKPHLNKKGLPYPKKPKRNSDVDDEEYF